MRRNYHRDLLVTVSSMRLLPHRIRPRVLALDRAIDISPRAILMPGIEMTGHGTIRIGHSFINSGCLLEGSGDIEIGRSVLLAPGVKVLTSTHEPGPPHQRGRKAIGLRTVVEDGVWIGANAVVLPGVRIARGCVVGAGAVVIRDCEPDGLYVGVPAVRKRDLPS